MPPTLTLTLDGPPRRTTGERLTGTIRVEAAEPVHVRELRWKLWWEACAAQRETDHRELVAERRVWQGDTLHGARELPFDVPLPPAPPSYDGETVRVSWHFGVTLETDTSETRKNVSLVLAPAPRPASITPQVEAWRRWSRAQARADALWRGVGGAILLACGVVLAGGLAAAAATGSVPVIAGALALAGLVGVGAAGELLGPLRRRLRRDPSRLSIHTPEPALLGATIALDLVSDAPEVEWEVGWNELAATRTHVTLAGRRRTDTRWTSRRVVVARGTAAGPRARVQARIPPTAPPTLGVEDREIRWEVRARTPGCEATAVFFVAPFVDT